MDKIAAPSQSVITGNHLVIIDDQNGWLTDYLIAGVAVAAIVLAFISTGPKDVVHWLILPAMICGILMGTDVVRWFQGSLDPFDPKGLIGLFGFHAFFLVPLLHVYWNFYDKFIYLTGDPRHWLGIAAILNALGILCYKVTQKWSFNRTKAVKTTWRLNTLPLVPVLAIAIIVGFSAHIVFYSFLAASKHLFKNRLEFAIGYGWLLMLSMNLPVLLLIALTSWTRMPRRHRNIAIVVLTISLLAVLQYVWEGYRGSRAAAVIGFIWGVGVIHYYWRRLPAVFLFIGGLLVVLPFLYFYGFYKSAGQEAFKAFEGQKAMARLERETGRTWESLILGDLGRADVQARIVNELVEGKNKYKLRYGSTYLVALSKLVPRTIKESLFFDPDLHAWSKQKAYCDLNWGKGFFDPIHFRPVRVYGLSGEAMLNFGLMAVPLAWLLFGIGVGKLRGRIKTLTGDDTRLAFIPFLSLMAVTLLLGDLDNFIFGTIAGGTVNFLCIFIWSQKNPKFIR